MVLMCTLIIKLPYIEVKFYPKLNSQTGLSLLRVSYKRALSYCFEEAIGLDSRPHFQDLSPNQVAQQKIHSIKGY